MTDQSPFTYSQLLNVQEVESQAQGKISNILLASASVSFLSWYMGDRQNDVFKKAALMAASQLFGATLVDVLEKTGKIDPKRDTMTNVIEGAASAGVYSIIALQGFRFPNANNKQFQEAVLGSLVGSFGGPRLADYMKPADEQ